MKLYLSGRFFALLGLCQLFGVCSLVEKHLLLPYLMTWPALVLLLLFDWFLLPARESFKFWFEFPNKVETGQTISVRLNVRTRNPRLGLQTFTVEMPISRLLAFRTPLIELRSSEPEFQIDIEAIARRMGYEQWDSIDVSFYSLIGLWTKIETIRIPIISFRISPPLTKTSAQAFAEVVRHQLIFQTGTRQILRGREPAQFHSIRPYQYPDPIRYIDAKRTARFQRLMTRTFDSLLTHHLVIGLDIGRSLMGQIGESAKYDYYISAALSLAENAVKSHDRVSFFSFSQKIHHLIPPTQRFGPFLTLFKGSANLMPREEESDYATFVYGTQRVAPQRSLILLLTDFSKPSIQTAALKALSTLSQKHLVVVAGVIDRRYNLTDSVLDFSGELEQEGYAHLLYNYWLEERIRNFQYHAAKFGIGTVLVHENDWMGVVTRLYSVMRSSIRM